MAPLPYINGVIWDTDTESWRRENGLAAAIKDEGGEFVPWDIHGEIFAHMCPTEQWRAKMRETVRKLVGEHGMSGVYLDCLAATGVRPCYDPRHGHTIRGGSYRAEGNRKLMHDLRADARSYAPEACFFTEEIGEIFLDCMDGFLTLDYLRSYCRPGERVFPFFSLVYHPYTINFGSDAAIGQDADAFRLQMGTLQAWGCQPLLSAIVAQTPKEGDPTSEFLRELVRHFHLRTKPYLTGGEWVPVSTRTPGSPASQRPIDILVAEHRVEYAKLRNRKRAWTGPAVLASAWKRGDSLAVTMVNITDREEKTRLTVRELANLGLPADCAATLWMGSAEDDSASPVSFAQGEWGTGRFADFVLPAGRLATCLFGNPKSQILAEAPRNAFRSGKDGDTLSFPASEPLAVDGATLVYGDDGKAQVADRKADGGLAPRVCLLAERNGPPAEGHGLPRPATAQPFAVGRRIGSGASPFVGEMHGADRSTLFATCTPPMARRLADPKAKAVLATDLATGKLVKSFTEDWPAGLPETGRLLVAICHHWGGHAEALASFVRMRIDLPTEEVRTLLQALETIPGERLSDEILAAASRTLSRACRDARDPKPFVADRPLAQAVEGLHALLCARTAMLPLVEIEDDWLSPGFAKTIRVTPAPGYPHRKPDSIEAVPVGDWSKGAVTVTEQVLDADQATNTHTFTLSLNDGLYVERMVPVLFFLKVTRDGHEFLIPEIVRLEANRPLHLLKPLGTAPAVVGREAQANFVLRNWSPHPFTARLRAEAPGFSAKLEAETIECPPLSDTPVAVRLVAGPETRPGAHRIAFSATWAGVPDAVSAACATVDLRESLVPVAAGGDWIPTPADNRATFRQTGSMVVAANEGETIRATIRNVRVTRYVDSCKATLRDIDGNVVWRKTIPVDEETQLAWQARTTGAHTLELLPGSGSAIVEVQNRTVGETASKSAPLKLFCSPIQRVFYVPKDAREFRFGSKDGGPDETAAIRLVSPAGRVVLERGLLEASPALPTVIAVRPDEAGKLWRLTVTPRQDISLWLEGDVCPMLSDSPARALRGRE